MDFQQVCELSGLPAKTVEYYVEEKIVIPFYPVRKQTDLAEYAQEDVIRLQATANLRRLDVPIPDIRTMLLNPQKAASFSIQHIARLTEAQKITAERAKALGQLELGNFQSLEDMLDTLAGLEIDLPLPARDIDHDHDRERRSALETLRLQVWELSATLEESEASRKRYFVIILVLVFLTLIAAGWILGPMILAAIL